MPFLLMYTLYITYSQQQIRLIWGMNIQSRNILRSLKKSQHATPCKKRTLFITFILQISCNFIDYRQIFIYFSSLYAKII